MIFLLKKVVVKAKEICYDYVEVKTMENIKETVAEEETSCTPRPVWQVWMARIGLVFMILFVIYQILQIAGGWR